MHGLLGDAHFAEHNVLLLSGFGFRSDPSTKKPIFPKETAEKMEQVMHNVESSLLQLASDFYDGDFSKVESSIKSLKLVTDQLGQYVSSEINRARENMKCCGVVHRIPPAPSRAWIFVVLIFIALCVWVVLGSCWIKDENEPGLPIMNRFL